MLTSAQTSFMLHLGLGGGHGPRVCRGFVTLLRRSTSHLQRVIRTVSTTGLAVIAVTTGTWLVYPGYRAKPTPGADLINYPQVGFQANEHMAVWHDFGMEWKPFLIRQSGDD